MGPKGPGPRPSTPDRVLLACSWILVNAMSLCFYSYRKLIGFLYFVTEDKSETDRVMPRKTVVAEGIAHQRIKEWFTLRCNVKPANRLPMPLLSIIGTVFCNHLYLSKHNRAFEVD